jgi:hypothetical protein
VAAVGRLDELGRPRIREAFRRRFRATRMAADHLRLYERLVARRREDREAAASPAARAAW